MQLASRYGEARHDPELLSLRDEIALVDVQISAVLAQTHEELPQRMLIRLIKQRPRLTESEAKRLILAGQMLNVSNSSRDRILAVG